MKTLIAIGLTLLLVVGLSFFFRGRPVRRGAQTPRPDVYDGLRAGILQGTRSSFNLSPTSAPVVPWGVVMDWGVTEGSATVVALSDGHASIYLSSGGGYLGGSQSHDSIRKAAQTAVTTAAEFQSLMKSTNAYPLPHRGEVIFYLLTDAGVFTASGLQQEMSSHRHKLSKLGDAMQLIITEYQRLQ
jgi:hypothetical protein